MLRIIAFLALMSSSVHAMSVDPDVHWRVLRTPHFEVIYDRDHRDLAEAYGVAAEQAYATLSHRFSEMPDKTYLVLDDHTDEANGAATFLPYPLIQVYPVLPDSLTSLDYFGNWPNEMIMHEYTHILTFQPSHGFYVPFRYVFGSVIHPNGILPRWYLEGLAVESESRFTEFGRLKSPHTSAEFRGLVQDDRLRRETIDRINETLIPEYPYGERPYLFGSLLWEHMAQFGPDDVVERLNQDYGRRFPFFPDQPVIDYFQSDYDHLLTSAYTRLERNVQAQLAAIQAKKPETFERFEESHLEEFQPVVSPDGARLIYIASGFRRGQVRGISRDDSTSFAKLKSEKLTDAIGTLRLSWYPDSQGFVFDAIDESLHYRSYRALFEYDIKTRQVHRLTRGARAQEPGVSKDGNLIAFIGNGSGRQWLGLLDRRKKSFRRLYQPGMSQRLSNPEFVSTDEIAFTARTLAGQEHLTVYNLTTKKLHAYFPNNNELRRPRSTNVGLLVADTSSGVQNISIADLKTEKLKTVTNTTTEIQSADWDPRAKELVAVRLTGEGRRLVTTPLEENQPTKIGSPITAQWPPVATPVAVDPKEFKDESYQPAEYLWPRYWVPFAYPVYNGVYMSGSTSMSDPAGINTYTASIAYDTVTNHGSYGFQYVNSSLPPDIDLTYTKIENYMGPAAAVITEQTALGGLSFYMPFLSPHWQMTAGYVGDQVQSPYNVNTLFRQGPLAQIVFSNWGDPRVEGNGTIFQVAQTQFLAGNGDVAYGRTMVGFQQGWHEGLPNRTRVVATVKGVWAPEMPLQDVVSLGDSSLGANYLVSLSNAQFLFRGYPTGEFVGRELVNWNLEYQFPLSKNASGWGTFPLFSRGWDGAVFLDGLGVDGGYYDYSFEGYLRRNLSEIALSTGFEARWNTTVAYDIPVTLILGLYFGFDQQAGDSYMPFVGIALSDLSAIDHLRNNWFKHF